MMFDDNTPIFLQLIDIMQNCIIRGEWKEGEKVPSVREVAMAYEVNPKTVVKAFDVLSSREIVIKKRGMGFYLAEHAKRNIMDELQKEFMQTQLPKFIADIKRLELSPEKVADLIRNSN